MLSARAGEEGIVEGLEAGADDYLVKPFSGRELRARVGSNLELDRVRRVSHQLERSLEIQNQAERSRPDGQLGDRTAEWTGACSDNLLAMLDIDRLELGVVDYERLIDAVIHPDDRRSVRDVLAAALEGGAAIVHDARLFLGTASERWIHIRGEVVRGEPPVRPARIRPGHLSPARGRACRSLTPRRPAIWRAFEHSVADELQQRLLPEPALRGTRLHVSSFYQAGVAGTRAGGDFYDMIDLGAGRTALTIGDVAGRGIAAASMMGQLRAAIHAYARLGLRPDELLDELDGVVEGLFAGSLVTCVFGVFDSASGDFVYAGAGHLPVLVVPPGRQPRRLPGATGPPLGTGFAHYGEHRVELEPGARIGLYTDGLVERRRGDLDANIDAAARELAAAAPLEALPGRLVADTRRRARQR